MLRQELALLAALLTVAVPSMVYTGTVMTENVFYGLFLVVTLAFVAMLERPTPARQVALLVLVVVAYLTRAQSRRVPPGGRSSRRSCSRSSSAGRCGRPCAGSRALYAIVVAGAALVVVAQVARGRSLGEPARRLLGRRQPELQRPPGRRLHALARGRPRRSTSASSRSPRRSSLVARARRESRPVQAFVAAADSARRLVHASSSPRSPPSSRPTGSTSATSSSWRRCSSSGCSCGSARHDGGAPRNWPLAVAACGACAALVPLTIPYGRFIGEPARADTLALIPVWTINRHFLAGSVLLTVGSRLRRARSARAARAAARPASRCRVVVLAWFALLLQPVFVGPARLRATRLRAPSSRGSAASTATGSTMPCPRAPTCPVLWSGPPVDRFVVNQNEFFNRDVGQVYYSSVPTPGGLYEKRIHFDRGGYARTDDGRLVRSAATCSRTARSRPTARSSRVDSAGVTLWRLHGPLLLDDVGRRASTRRQLVGQARRLDAAALPRRDVLARHAEQRARALQGPQPRRRDRRHAAA